MAAWRAVGAVTVFLASAMAPAVTAAPAVAGGCAAVSHVDSQWGSGEIVSATVTNTATVTSTKWTVSWTLTAGQRVQSMWNAGYTQPDSTTVVASNLPYNGTLAPGGSTSFGMQLSGTGPAPVMSCTSDAVTTVTLTQADSRGTVTVHVGQTVVVSLSADFRPVTESGTALALVSTTGGYPSGQPLLATYRAAALGAVDLNTITDNACLHAPMPCAIPQMLWTVHVTVVS